MVAARLDDEDPDILVLAQSRGDGKSGGPSAYDDVVDCRVDAAHLGMRNRAWRVCQCGVRRDRAGGHGGLGDNGHGFL